MRMWSQSVARWGLYCSSRYASFPHSFTHSNVSFACFFPCCVCVKATIRLLFLLFLVTHSPPLPFSPALSVGVSQLVQPSARQCVCAVSRCSDGRARTTTVCGAVLRGQTRHRRFCADPELAGGHLRYAREVIVAAAVFIVFVVNEMICPAV